MLYVYLIYSILSHLVLSDVTTCMTAFCYLNYPLARPHTVKTQIPLTTIHHLRVVSLISTIFFLLTDPTYPDVPSLLGDGLGVVDFGSTTDESEDKDREPLLWSGDVLRLTQVRLLRYNVWYQCRAV